ncbi:alpha/beta fold hydrolase [Saccharopolyspora rosea]|uniref:Alpha/beta fold hydrolase n=1 Tax=Saccharopolyspora rosea TaxID=524884 RepID=A0ABW3FQZ9_9PSEU|nr:alpha/beta hydrolase [Saccharopolyspora rosea]
MKLDTAPITEFTTSDGTRLRVVVDGPADAPVTVLFVHGWALTRHAWERVATGLPKAADVPVRTLRFDLRGHGESDPAPPGSAHIARCADDVAELITELVADGPLVLAGHSMGGMTIMALAERHPELFDARVAAVALVGTSGGDLVAPDLGLPRPVAALVNRVERVVRRRLAVARGRRFSPQAGPLRPGLRWLLFGTDPDPADVAATAEWVAGCHPANMAGFRESLAAHDRIRVLEALRAKPTVIAAGLDDRLCPLPHARRIADAVPEAELLLYAGAGHMLPLERAGEITSRIGRLVTTAAERAQGVSVR